MVSENNGLEILAIITKKFKSNTAYKTLLGFDSLRYFDSQKVLQDDTVFSLNSNFEITYNPEKSIKIKHVDTAFNLFSNDAQFVQVSAIVGQNGSGKSTLTEILYLMLYNLATSNEILKDEKGNPIKEEKGLLNSILVLKSQSKFVAIDFEFLDYFNYEDSKKNDSKKIRYFTDSFDESNESLLDLTNKSKPYKIKDLFYLLAMNYSMYGLNEKKMGSWIKNIFHKNDMYQTPIVLNPYREKGIIDVNTEDEQNTSRLISNLSTRSKESFNPIISSDYILHHYNFFYSKIDRRSIYFNKENKSYFKSLKLEGDRFNFDPLIFIDREAYNDKRKTKTKEIPTSSTPASRFQNWINNEQEKTLKNHAFVQLLMFNSEKQISLIHSYFFNLKSKINLDNLASNLSFDTETAEIFITDLFSYFIVKLYRIGINYHDEFGDLLNKEKNGFNKLKEFESAFQRVILSNSHVCFKLKRTYFFMNYTFGEGVFNFIVATGKPQDEVLFTLNPIHTEIPKTLEYKNENSKIPKPPYANDFFNQIDEHYFSVNDLQWRIPPPIFIFNCNVSNVLTNETVDLNKLSSGETQFIYTLQSILYHLINLNSNFKSKGLFYKNIILLLDEIELYHHPEYQRAFISTLLSQISELQLKNIKSIQIIALTHSPFILSDIPSQNVLRLEKGEPSKKPIQQTFGANIHDLLANDFFLNDGFMGEFAKEYVQNLFKEIYNLDKNEKLSTEYYLKTIKRIELIGERIIQIRLKDLLNELPREKNEFDRKIEEAEQLIINLKKLRDAENRGQ